jgi:pimeloyl-ACP methyl ester carboxylesterase
VADIPRGQFIKVDGVGHNIHTERAEWLTETVTEWLQTVTSGDTRKHEI